jgi:3-oxoacyl-[acyl-carrier-protein] synthase-3
MEFKKAGIAGTGMYVPEGRLTNDDLSEMVDTSDEWITTRTGIKERRIISKDQACSDLAVEAGKRALDDAGLRPDDIDLVIVGTVTGDYQFPATACLVQDRLGVKKAGAFDVSAACNGFITGCSTAAKFIQTGEAKNVLVIGVEALTRFVNYKDRTSCILFGDGAGAMVISSRFERGEILSSELGADGSGWNYMYIPAGGSRQVTTPQTAEKDEHLMIIRGREVYKFAVNRMVYLVKKAVEMNPGVDFGMVIPHQVNIRIIESAREKLSLRKEDIAVNIDKLGNTSAASAPIMFHEAKAGGQLDDMVGKLLVLCAFGAGLNWGYVAVKW